MSVAWTDKDRLYFQIQTAIIITTVFGVLNKVAVTYNFQKS